HNEWASKSRRRLSGALKLGGDVAGQSSLIAAGPAAFAQAVDDEELLVIVGWGGEKEQRGLCVPGVLVSASTLVHQGRRMAFGNAKTAHNNNSSRFGKFIQVNYQETGTVRGAYVEKYLLEKSRLVYQEHNERNYHVFYYLLAGASEEERSAFHLKQPEEYHYLNQDCFSVEGEDLKHDFERLQLAMEMVGFLPKTRRQIFSLLSAILHLGNIRYKKKTYRDDSIDICNPEILPIVSDLLE
ncbi:PREDICTED: unconventional myosin-IXa-like, partial [Phaethon lepturus]|uniref:unconventional myosin-IXa-like n=1 Tax=Phaethon lepturus TaxID=97097 RepID=UPI0005306497